MTGALISAQFRPDNKGQGVASRIAILAMPGEVLRSAGRSASSTCARNQFACADANNDQSYKISFDPAAFPEARDLHEGATVKVTAEFDGTRYVARSIDHPLTCEALFRRTRMEVCSSLCLLCCAEALNSAILKRVGVTLR